MIALDNKLVEVFGPLQESLQVFDVRVDAAGGKAPRERWNHEVAAAAV
ncbi:hypothetical protein [Streptomyces sp. NPDC049813]